MKRIVFATLALAALLVPMNALGSTLPPVNPAGSGGRMECEPAAATAASPAFLITSNWGTLTLTAVGNHPHHDRQDWCHFQIRFTGNYALIGAGPGSGGGIANPSSAGCIAWTGQSCTTTASIGFYFNLVGGRPGIRLEYELWVDGARLATGWATLVDPPLPGHEGETLAQVATGL